MRLEGIWLSQQCRKGQPEEEAPTSACLVFLLTPEPARCCREQEHGLQGKGETPFHVPLVQKLGKSDLFGKIPAVKTDIGACISKRSSGNLLQPYAKPCKQHITPQLAGDYLPPQILIQESQQGALWTAWVLDQPRGPPNSPASSQIHLQSEEVANKTTTFLLLLEGGLPFG